MAAVRTVKGKRLVLVAVLALACAGAAAWLAFAAAPAQAFDAWEHGTAGSCASCHPNPSDQTCANCHTGFRVSPQPLPNGQATTCWSCHEPGQDMSSFTGGTVACAQTCHLFSSATNGYSVEFSHGFAPHLGANYAPCSTCHETSVSWNDPGGSPHHDAVAQQAPNCQACHDGAFASLQVSHDGEDCTSCHRNGMTKPAVSVSFCLGCHESAQHPEAKQIDYTVTTDCTACHGLWSIHSATPGASVADCTSCHAAHYQSLGACTTCHSDPAGYHHTGAALIPLSQCTVCHDGTIASAKVTHDGLLACTSCHTGMNIPAAPATCTICHEAATFGTADCTTCHGPAGIFGSDQIHNAGPNAHRCTQCHIGYQKHAGQVSCKTCHTTATAFHHAVTTSPGSKQCADCHKKTHAGRRLAATTCASCHRGTAPKADPAVQHSSTVKKLSRCSVCHSTIQVHAKTRRSSMSCRSCHTGRFHRRMPVPTSSTCLKCHSSARSHAVGFPCLICHKSAVHDATPSAGLH